MLTVGIVLDDTNRRKGKNLKNIVEAFTRKIEDWKRAAKANIYMPLRDKTKILKSKVLPKALYGTELTLNWT